MNKKLGAKLRELVNGYLKDTVESVDDALSLIREDELLGAWAVINGIQSDVYAQRGDELDPLAGLLLDAECQVEALDKARKKLAMEREALRYTMHELLNRMAELQEEQKKEDENHGKTV